MCYADLINIDNSQAGNGGAGGLDGHIHFEFDAFAFSEQPSQVSMVSFSLI